MRRSLVRANRNHADVRLCASILVLLVATSIFGSEAFAQSDSEYEHEAIGYSTATPENAVTRLQAALEEGRIDLSYDKEFGWLPAVLRELNVDSDSQMLVFSKTSLQRNRISPQTPRALYFNDDVYVGYCHNGDVLEISAVDPRLGTVFYTVDQTADPTPNLLRQTDNCLICHASSSHTGGVPGHVVRSLFADAGGLPLLAAGSFRTDPNSPIEERWGGWYVSGQHGDQQHLGNLIVRDKTRPDHNVAENLNVADLSERFDTSAYLTPHSDIVALLLMEHQTAMHNKITQANFATRRALWDEKVLDEAFGDSTDTYRESTLRRIANSAEPVVEYLLFSGEAPLKAKYSGTSGFTESFVTKGPQDAQGRSLRQFDLEHRIFKYPCSYLIYSEAFTALPQMAKDVIYRRLYEVLTGEDTSNEFAHLTREDRTAIFEILLATHPDLPDYWKTNRK